jgi:hypothetical protein
VSCDHYTSLYFILHHRADYRTRAQNTAPSQPFQALQQPTHVTDTVLANFARPHCWHLKFLFFSEFLQNSSCQFDLCNFFCIAQRTLLFVKFQFCRYFVSFTFRRCAVRQSSAWRSLPLTSPFRHQCVPRYDVFETENSVIQLSEIEFCDTGTAVGTRAPSSSDPEIESRSQFLSPFQQLLSQ